MGLTLDQNITFEDIKMNLVGQAIVISEYYQSRPPTNATATPQIKDITFRNIQYVHVIMSCHCVWEQICV